MKKRLLSILLAVIMVVSLLPVMTFAETGHNHEGWTAWGDKDGETTSLPTAAGSYYLTKDVTFSNSRWEIPNNVTINLCLNGNVITLDGNRTGNNNISIKLGATLNLYDCGTTEHKFTVVENGLWNYVGDWNSQQDDESETVKKVIGGCITGGKNEIGGAIYLSWSNDKNVSGAALNLYGGNIVGNQSTTGNGGGAVYVDRPSTFNMYGGRIIGNTAVNNGGAVYLHSENNVQVTFNMYGGTISDCKANAGGAVFVETNGTFNMSSGTISGNTAETYAGGVFVSGGAFNMTGGTISGNTATTNAGGGVHVNGGEFNMSSGTISGNTATTNAGGVNVESGNLAIASGSSISNNNGKIGAGVYFSGTTFTMSGGSIDHNTASQTIGGVYSANDITLGGNAKITDNVINGTITDGVLSGGTEKNLLLGTNKLIILGTKTQSDDGNGVLSPAEDMLVGITINGGAGRFTTNGAITDIKHFSSDSKDYKVCLNAGTEIAGDEYLELTAITIADILATVEGGFPTTSLNGWTNGSSKLYVSASALYLDETELLPTDTILKASDGGFVYTNNGATKSHTFHMNSGILEKVTLSGFEDSENGDYASSKTAITPVVSLEGWTYGDTANTPSVTGNTGNGEVTYKYKVKGAADDTYKTDAPTKAGNYVVKVEIAETDEYTTGSATTEFAIAKKPVTITAKDKSAYVGEAAPQLSENDYTVTGLVGSDTLTTPAVITYELTPDMTKAGSVAINVSGADAGNNYEIAYVSGTLTISNRPYSGGNSSSSTVTVPVSGDTNNVKVQATVSGSTATVKPIKDADIAKVTDGESVSIDLSGAGKNVDTAKIPTETVEKIAEKSSMTVKLPVAAVEFDKAATKEIVDQAKGSNIELVVDDIKEVSLNAVQKEAVKKLDTAVIIDAYLASNGTRLCTEEKGGFGRGKANVILPYEIKNNRTAANYSVYYVDDTGNRQKLDAKYDEELKAFVFEIEHFSVYAVAYDGYVMPFVDVSETAYYYDAVKWAAANAITSGTDTTHFNPLGITTRGQMVTFLWNAAGKPEPVSNTCKFTDIKEGAYYYKAVLWAYEKGITDGTSETTFEPDMNVSRAQVVTFLWRYAGKPVVNYFMQMTDVASDRYYTEAVRWALSEKITDGTSKTTFSPNDDCLRGQIVTFLYRGFEK